MRANRSWARHTSIRPAGVAILVLATIACFGGPTRHYRLGKQCSELTVSEATQPIRIVRPHYPSTPVQQAPHEAWVDVSFSLNESGKPIDLRVTESVPEGRFDRFATESVQSWRFCPPAEVAETLPTPLKARLCFQPYGFCPRCPECQVEFIGPWTKL